MGEDRGAESVPSSGSGRTQVTTVRLSGFVPAEECAVLQAGLLSPGEFAFLLHKCSCYLWVPPCPFSSRTQQLKESQSPSTLVFLIFWCSQVLQLLLMSLSLTSPFPTSPGPLD